jgi:RNA polymerase-binding transcription factor DksA
MAVQKAAKKSAAPATEASAKGTARPATATSGAAQSGESEAVTSAPEDEVEAPPAPAKAPAPAVRRPFNAPIEVHPVPVVKGTTKEGISYTKDFDVKFLIAQKAALLEQRAELVGQAVRLEDEANSLIEEQEMGDVEFGDEGGEGDTMVVERERDLALSAQARQMVDDIDAALIRLGEGTYGYSLESWRPIPRERLEAIPWATALVEEKVGGLGRR